MKRINHFITITLLLCASTLFAQQIKWKELSLKDINSTDRIVQSVQPKKFKLFKLNANDLIVNTNKSGNNRIISLPNKDGKSIQYTYEENSILSPDLQRKFPNIKTYKGKSIDGKQIIKFSYSPYHGFNAVIINQNKISYIDSYSKNLETYISYDKSDLKEKNKFSCLTTSNNEKEPPLNRNLQTLSTNSNEVLRKYRLAVATTVEYSKFHIERADAINAPDYIKKEIVLSAINIAIDRVNSIYEKELSITFELVSDNEKIIFIDQDEYSNFDGVKMISENQRIIDREIGNSNYDIGHVFSTGGGGLAYLAKTCNNNFKAAGVTGSSNPINDPYYVDYVSHEIGHQFGANHIFTSTQEFCSNNKELKTSVEPGSGSSIMGYAGICGTENIQENSDPYFNAINIDEINKFINSAGSCSINSPTNNTKPIIKLNKTNFVIPHSTPFKLTAEATDNNQDVLTYNWEQIDSSKDSNLPISTNQSGPLFRSIEPSINNYRYFPKLEKILSNNLTTQKNTNPIEWEILPNIERSLKFALTVRDNNPNGGLTDRKDIIVQVKNTGPFKLTSQLTAENWKANEQRLITWDIANTNGSDINTTHVKILLSFDGGLTWNYTLKDSTPNNGKYQFTVPYGIGNTSDARIMIQPIDNIYFAINTTNFIIDSPELLIKHEDLSGPTISPNPAIDKAQLILHKDYSDIEIYIYDMTGKLVFNKISYQSKTKVFQLNLSHLINSVYLVKIIADTEDFTKKIIIKK